MYETVALILQVSCMTQLVCKFHETCSKPQYMKVYIAQHYNFLVQFYNNLILFLLFVYNFNTYFVHSFIFLTVPFFNMIQSKQLCLLQNCCWYITSNILETYVGLHSICSWCILYHYIIFYLGTTVADVVVVTNNANIKDEVHVIN